MQFDTTCIKLKTLFADLYTCSKSTKHTRERYTLALGQWLYLGNEEEKKVLLLFQYFIFLDLKQIRQSPKTSFNLSSQSLVSVTSKMFLWEKKKFKECFMKF